MTRKFKPCISILPQAQKQLWPELINAADLGFTLYGETAIALRLGHRESIDFDFFTERTLDREELKAAFPFIERSTVLQDQKNTFVLNVPFDDTKNSQVQVSFFGEITFGRVGEPDFTEDGVLQVASFDDLMATKLKVILQRAEKKDYQDIAAMISAGVSLARGLSSARQMFGANFQPSESIKALTYFNDGDLKNLIKGDREILTHAVQLVRELPSVTLRSNSLSDLSLDHIAERDLEP